VARGAELHRQQTPQYTGTGNAYALCCHGQESANRLLSGVLAAVVFTGKSPDVITRSQ
jgi:hypothetical protein